MGYPIDAYRVGSSLLNGAVYVEHPHRGYSEEPAIVIAAGDEHGEAVLRWMFSQYLQAREVPDDYCDIFQLQLAAFEEWRRANPDKIRQPSLSRGNLSLAGSIALGEARQAALDAANAVDTLTRLRFTAPARLSRCERVVVRWALTQLTPYCELPPENQMA